MSFDDFLNFRMYITKTFMKFIYIIGAILITLGSFALMIGGALPYNYYSSIGSGGILGGLALLTLGNLGWRLICEAIIIIFSIHEKLVSIDNKINTKNPQTQLQIPKKFCQNCGTEITQKDKFCSNCGKNLTT
jgi:ribosomal protein S27AE